MQKFRQSTLRPKKSSLKYGRLQVLHALHEGVEFAKIFLETSASSKEINEIKKIALEKIIPISFVPIAKLNAFNVANHEGVIGLVSKVRFIDLQQIIDFEVNKGNTPLFVILDGITDIRNIGGIARTAFSCGVQTLIIPEKGVGSLNEDAILTSAGALEHLPVCRVKSIPTAIETLHLNGIKVLAAEMEGQTMYRKANYQLPLALVLGSEGKGVHPSIIPLCDETIFLPMQNNFESLNVGVAGGIILYEVFIQRKFS